MSGSLAFTLLLALGAALVFGAIAHRLRLAPMIGYIAAGLLVGPFTPGLVANTEEVLGLADIGVALLMFSIGLRFHLRELLEVGRTVVLGATLQVALTTALAVGVLSIFGIDLVQAIFLGAVVSVCSSVVMVKVAGDTVLQTTTYGRLAFAWSIVQDLLTIVLVVALSALAVESDQPLLDGLLSTLVGIVFVAAVLVIGSRLLPAILSRVALLGTRDLFIVAVAVIAVGTATLANEVGVSVALGAFVAGLALADSDLAASVLGEVVPLRELFATFFFISVGILLHPDAIVEGWWLVLALLVLIVAGKLLPIAAILRIGGHPPGTSLRAAGLVSQAGEFSFVLATVGLELGALGDVAFSEAMGAVVLSILIAGPVASFAARAGDWVESRWPMADGAAPPDAVRGMRRHAIVIGYGVVGRTVCRVLQARGVPWVAIEGDYRLARNASGAGLPVIYGDAASTSVLEAAGVESASVLVIAVPDPLAARHAVQHAVSRNPRIHVVARAHSASDELDLQRLGAARVITAEREMGHEIVRHTLSRYGVSEREVDAILRRR
ncbi:MAG TPA: cation:proton antiporter [Candidatus Limnocylindria bacterium]